MSTSTTSVRASKTSRMHLSDISNVCTNLNSAFDEVVVSRIDPVPKHCQRIKQRDCVHSVPNDELMLLGFISLLLTATSSIISNICISSKFYDNAFAPCTRYEVEEDNEDNASQERKLLMAFVLPHSSNRVLNTLNHNTCKKDYEPFVSYEGLKQLHRFIFVMAITHISYSCLTMLLTIVKSGVNEGGVHLEELNILLCRSCSEYWERLKSERVERIRQTKEHWESQCWLFMG